MTRRRPEPVTYQCPICKGRYGETITLRVEHTQPPYCTRNGVHKPKQMEVVT